MKMIKTVVELVNKALKNKEGYACIKRDGVLVYEVTYNKKDKIIKLYHYQTLTAEINNGKLIYVYGESVSDSDSITTFVFTVNGIFNTDCVYNFGYKPVNGGFWGYKIKNGKSYLSKFSEKFKDGYRFANALKYAKLDK